MWPTRLVEWRRRAIVQSVGGVRFEAKIFVSTFVFLLHISASIFMSCILLLSARRSSQRKLPEKMRLRASLVTRNDLRLLDYLCRNPRRVHWFDTLPIFFWRFFVSPSRHELVADVMVLGQRVLSSRGTENFAFLLLITVTKLGGGVRTCLSSIIVAKEWNVFRVTRSFLFFFFVGIKCELLLLTTVTSRNPAFCVLLSSTAAWAKAPVTAAPLYIRRSSPTPVALNSSIVLNGYWS